jgi:hypothetical protein
LASGGLMIGLPQTLKQGVNHQEYAAELMKSMAFEIHKITQSGGVGTPDALAGLQNLAGQSIQGQPIKGNGAANHIALLDKAEGSKQIAKQLGDALSKLMNELKAFAQRQQEQMKKQQAEAAKQNGHDPKDAAKAQALVMTAKNKMELAKESHAQKTAQRQIAFQAKMKQDAQRHHVETTKDIHKHAVELAHERQQHAADLEARDLEAEAAIKLSRKKAKSTGGDDA